MTSRNVTAGRVAISEEQVKALARASSGDGAMTALTSLHDAIIRPIDASLARASHVVVIADPLLEGVPFAALFDGRHYLVERTAVAIASSATSLVHDQRPRRAASVLAIGLPSGDSASTKGLPESEREVQDIAHFYSRATSIAAPEATWAAFTRAASNATDVVHIAGHTERQQGAGDAALLFAGTTGGGIQPISWKNISAAPHIDAGVVVLAACETLRRPAAANTRALTLAEAFAASGARDVAGTLVPIADRDARELFRALHQYLASGDDAVDALRRVQLQSLRGEATHGLPAWAGLGVLTTRIP